MRRMQLLEIHDQPWFPGFLRDQVTDALQLILNLGKLYRPVAWRLAKALEAADAHEVLDLCSGAGGPWPWLYEFVARESRSSLSVCLTDKYPNAPAFARVQAASGDNIRFHDRPVDVQEVPPRLGGFRTIFTSFHHFPPPQARAILQDAVDRRRGIAIFEVPGRHVLTILLVFLVPVADWIFTPLLRPFRWSRLLWTYLIPVIPAVLWLDGMVSCLRVYSPPELTGLVRDLSSADAYHWQIGEEREGILSLPITYLVGYPPAGSNTCPPQAESASHPSEVSEGSA